MRGFLALDARLVTNGIAVMHTSRNLSLFVRRIAGGLLIIADKIVEAHRDNALFDPHRDSPRNARCLLTSEARDIK